VIVLALVMGLVFGGLRVASAAQSAAEFGRVSQLASLGQQVTGLVQALQDERDETTGVSSGGDPDTLVPWYNATDAAVAKVRALAAGVGGSFPANIQASVATVLSEINHLGELRKTAQASQDALAVIANYAAPISDMIYHTFTDQFFGDGEQQALTTALSEELNDKAAFEATATPAEQSSFNATVTGQGVNVAEGIEDFILTDGNPAHIKQLGISLSSAPARWYSAMSDKIDKMQAVELEVARNIVARSQVLRRSAEQAALVNAGPREPAPTADSTVSDWFRSPRSSAPDNSAPGDPAPGDGGSSAATVPGGGGWRAGAEEWAESKHAAEIVAEPVRGDHTAAGLPVRVPRANLIAGSAGGHRAGGPRLADGRGTQTAPAARAPRSPEHARARLSGFQRGTRRAKGQTPRAGEGADR